MARNPLTQTSTYREETPFTKLIEDVQAADNAKELVKFFPSDKELKEDYDLRMAHMKTEGIPPVTLNVPWKTGLWDATVENLLKALVEHPNTGPAEVIRWIRSSSIKKMQLTLFKQLCQNLAERGATLLEIASKLLEDKEDELKVQSAALNSMDEQIADLQTKLNTANNSKDSWFDKHAELLTKYNALRQRVVDGETGDVSILSERSHGGGNHKKGPRLPHPKALTDKATPTEYKHWKSEMENKIEQEEFNDSAAKAYFMNQVEGTAKDTLLLLHDALQVDRKDLSLQHMWEAMSERFADPFEKQNAKKAFKTLNMKAYADFHDFKNQFITMATAARIDKEDWKQELHDKLYTRLREGTAREGGDPSVDFKTLCFAAANLSRTYKQTYEDRTNAEQKKKDEQKRTATTSSTGNGSRGGSSGRSASNTTGNGGSGSGATPYDSGFRKFRDYNLDVNQAIKLTQEKKCFKCKKEGHFANNCPDTSITELTPETDAMVVAQQPKN
jgi:hypothetical protein